MREVTFSYYTMLNHQKSDNWAYISVKLNHYFMNAMSCFSDDRVESSICARPPVSPSARPRWALYERSHNMNKGDEEEKKNVHKELMPFKFILIKVDRRWQTDGWTKFEWSWMHIQNRHIYFGQTKSLFHKCDDLAFLMTVSNCPPARPSALNAV